MSESLAKGPLDTYSKAKDLVVTVKFENDDSTEGKIRTRLAKEIVCHLILLGQKKGRPSKKEVPSDVAA